MILDVSKVGAIRDALTVYLSNGKIEECATFFRQKSDDVPELFRLELLGNISFYQGDIVEAIKFYEAATLLSPKHLIPRYFYLAGVKNERKGNFVDAFKYYQTAIEAEPSFVDSYVELGALLVKVGDFASVRRL
ncbi:tetratricopeptide (TPR) repeat protein [Pseudomonas sp. GGS8]|uniref:tetratricopeptide repeat protein n=1 Tax=Pseudomonas sp. GGS8 TaxID=2817892 RepID=UPI00209D0305|nr:tetratricopeptide repeat protein [Pseudomonas sp. GGS8]MCP1443234.1 tetratricopeptide (TPR) repeat protein [Pseudomonas sp. GGS8]